MTEWSRRNLLRLSAGAAVAVPMVALASSTATAGDAAVGSTGSAFGTAVPDEPVMFCIHDARRGEVSILHGANEVIVRDRQLVARILNVSVSTRA